MEITAAKTIKEQVFLSLRLAWPVIVENLLVTMVNIVDTAMVGSLGAKATAAVALTASPTWVMGAIVMSMDVGTAVLVAKRIGAGDWERARSGARQTLVLGLFFGFFFFLLAESLAGFIPVWMGGEASVIPQSVTFLRIVALGYPTFFAGLILCGPIRGAGDMATPMKITALTNILNIIGNFFLIYQPRNISIGPFSFSIWGAGLGVTGAAISTAFATTLSGVLLIFLLFWRKEGLFLDLQHSYRLIREDMKEIFCVALPTAMERVTINLGQVFFIRIVSSLGTAQLAAHQLAITAESISYNPGFGFASAAVTLVGQSLGAKDQKLAERYGSITIWASFILMFFCGIILFVFARPLISLFTPDSQVIDYGAMALRIVAFAQPFFGMALTGSGVLRGVGDAKITVPIAITCMWGIRLSLAAFFVFVLDLGLAGAWYAMIVDLVLRGIVTSLRFYSGKWKKKYQTTETTAI